MADAVTELAADVAANAAQRTAEAVAVALLAADRVTRGLSARVVGVGPGRARLEMAVRDDMLNGLDTCHGGVIATLADSAFAVACNSYDEVAVAAGFSVDFIAPGRAGDVLTADAVEQALAGRTGVYDVTVRNQRAEIVAVFRGRSHRLRGRSVVGRPAAADAPAEPAAEQPS